MTLEIRVFDTDSDLAEAVATQLLDRLAGHEPAAEVVLTGGSIADQVHRAVATAARDQDIPALEATRFWWGDERFVAADSSDRNDLQARVAMLDPLGVPARQLMTVAADDGTLDVADAARAYAEQVDADGPDEFDLVMLGIGPDGHVASLFPGHPALTTTDTAAVEVRDSPKPPPQRVTLTLPVLNRAREVWFLAAGEEKAEAVARALAAAGTVNETPARGVGAPNVVWWLEAEAASLISDREVARSEDDLA